jgi:hypothetical protein
LTFEHHFQYASSITSGITDKARENRARRSAERQGLRLKKSGRRDPRALDYRGYWLLSRTGAVVAGGQHGTTLDRIETELGIR